MKNFFKNLFRGPASFQIDRGGCGMLAVMIIMIGFFVGLFSLTIMMGIIGYIKSLIQ